MLKYALIATAAALVISIGWPLASAVFGDSPNEATQLVEATERANTKAESLNDSFTDVIPPAPAARYMAQSGEPADDGVNLGDDYGSAAGGISGDATGPMEPTPSPTPDKYAQYQRPSEHAVRDAIEFLNDLRNDPDVAPSRTDYIQAVEQLEQAWTPRYGRAVQEYKRFAYRIDHADEMAVKYFRVQENLTSHIASARDRRRAEQIDAAEREAYLKWRDQAFKTLGQATSIMIELDDMNIVITKQNLSAHFAAPVRGLPDHPSGHHHAPQGAGQVPGRVGKDPADLWGALELRQSTSGLARSVGAPLRPRSMPDGSYPRRNTREQAIIHNLHHQEEAMQSSTDLFLATAHRASGGGQDRLHPHSPGWHVAPVGHPGRRRLVHGRSRAHSL